jgi:chromosome segregation ATPase
VSGLKKQLKLLKRRQKLGSKESLVDTEKKCEEHRKKAEQLEAQLVANSTDASEVKWENHHLKQRLANQPNADTNSDEVKTILAAKDTIYEEIHSKYKTQTLEYKLLQESFTNLKAQYCKQLDSANEIKSDQQTKIVVLEDQTTRLREQLAEAREQAEREVVAVPLKRSSRENSTESGISKREFNSLHEKYTRYAKKEQRAS